MTKQQPETDQANEQRKLDLLKQIDQNATKSKRSMFFWLLVIASICCWGLALITYFILQL